MCESFFATLECELLDRRRFASQAEARVACFSFIEGWYNPVRLHSALLPLAHSLRTRHANRAAADQVLKPSTKTGQLQINDLAHQDRRRACREVPASEACALATNREGSTDGKHRICDIR